MNDVGVDFVEVHCGSSKDGVVGWMDIHHYKEDVYPGILSSLT